MPEWLADVKDLVAILAVVVGPVVSLVALGISLRSLNTARAALKISKAQEERRLRTLTIASVDILFDRDSERTRYLVTVAVSNTSDSPNAVATAELWVNYRQGVNRFTFKASRDADSEIEALSYARTRTLMLPARIEAGNTIEGTFGFTVPRSVIDPGSIEDYKVVLFDTHKNTVAADASLPRKANLFGVDNEA